MSPRNSVIHISNSQVSLTQHARARAVMVTPSRAQAVARYSTFNDHFGTNVTFSFDNGHTATLVNGIRWVTGKIVAAVSANAVKKQYVSLPAIRLNAAKAVICFVLARARLLDNLGAL